MMRWIDRHAPFLTGVVLVIAAVLGVARWQGWTVRLPTVVGVTIGDRSWMLGATPTPIGAAAPVLGATVENAHLAVTIASVVDTPEGVQLTGVLVNKTAGPIQITPATDIEVQLGAGRTRLDSTTPIAIAAGGTLELVPLLAARPGEAITLRFAVPGLAPLDVPVR